MTNGYPPPSNTVGKTSLFLGLFASIFIFCTGLCAGIGKEQGWLQRVGLLLFVCGATSAFMGFLATLLGLGNGAVFALVPKFFPNATGTVTGLVGAMGGLGGFFPPLLLGVFRDRLGAIWPGFALLALTCFALYRLNATVHPARLAEGL